MSKERAGQKIKQDELICIGENIRQMREKKGYGQMEMTRLLQLKGIPMTRQALIKIETGHQHIQACQLEGIRDVLGTSYEELLKHTDEK